MKRLDAYWDHLNPVALLLSPLSLLFCLIAGIRRRLYRMGLLSSQRVGVPVIVVGNISVGGTGKTPLVIALSEFLRDQGYRPGIISRGYGGAATDWPLQVVEQSDPAQVGDEPLLMARRTGLPLWVGPDRPAAARALLRTGRCDLIICDDGLQHYALQRDLEIAVIDGERRFGNGLCLPAGPLRERRSRLSSVDLVVVNGGQAATAEGSMQLQPRDFVNLQQPQQRLPLDAFRGETVHAFAGIGHPDRFFATLEQLGIRVIRHPCPDHHRFSPGDFAQLSGETVIMTEKDAVKCYSFAQPNFWYLAVDAVLDTDSKRHLLVRLRGVENG